VNPLDKRQKYSLHHKISLKNILIKYKIKLKSVLSFNELYLLLQNVILFVT